MRNYAIFFIQRHGKRIRKHLVRFNYSRLVWNTSKWIPDFNERKQVTLWEMFELRVATVLQHV